MRILGGILMNQSNINKYTQTYGTRFTRAQKKKSIEALSEDFKALGYESTLIRGKKFISRADNYLYGNLKQMKTVIVVPYDTPERKVWHKVLYFPFDGTRTANKTMVATYVPVLILFAIIFGSLYGLQPMITSLEITTIMSLVLFALTLGLMYWMLHGIHNAHNYNRNSASILAALEIAGKLDKDERKKVGFLFTDKNKMRFLGAESSVNDFVNNGKNPNFIALDCIGLGSNVKIAYNPQNRKLANEVAKNYPDKKIMIECIKLSEEMRLQTAMTHFKKAIVISSGECDEDGNLFVLGSGTSKDTKIDETLIDNISTMVYKYLHIQK